MTNHVKIMSIDISLNEVEKPGKVIMFFVFFVPGPWTMSGHCTIDYDHFILLSWNICKKSVEMLWFK
jgi:hypothetical protein